MKRILDRHREQQDLLTALSEQLQNVWLGNLLLLGDPDQTRSATTTTASKLSHHRRLHMNSMQHLHSHSAAGSSSSGYSLDYRNLEAGSGRGDGGGGDGGVSGRRRGVLRLSRNKRLALKVAVLLEFGASMIAMVLVLNMR
ncbi:hypothetical protein BGW39_007586 [Mortierella sp. 14UC]|nr:hypothetical protein BGW39_007586 [Mortierella sp. 14UC]